MFWALKSLTVGAGHARDTLLSCFAQVKFLDVVASLALGPDCHSLNDQFAKSKKVSEIEKT